MHIIKAITFLIIFVFLCGTVAAVDFKKLGYDAGYKKGSTDGKNIGKYDCQKYGTHTVLRVIPSPVISPSWSVLYKNGYRSGYSAGFKAVYHATRFVCLRR